MIDINSNKIRTARHNARIYVVEYKIEFINGNFLEIAPTLETNVVFLSPPWGGPDYKKNKGFDMNTILKPIGGMRLYNIAARISRNVTYFLLKNVNMLQVRFR
jgi:trimethylguanosine synthase